MTKKAICLIAVVSSLGCINLSAEEGTTKPAEGTLTLQKKAYPLSRAVAFETTIDNEEAITVVVSAKPIPGEKIKEAREKDKESGDTDFGRPFLKLVFTKTGEFKHWSAAAGGTMIGRRSGKGSGEIITRDGRVSGKANQPEDDDGMFSTAFDVHFDVPLLKASDAPPATVVKKPGPAANVPPTVTGVFKGNGKEGNLKFVSARWGEPFSGKTGIVLVFTEKDHSKVKKPDFDASFGKFGSALIISLHEDGDIYGCQVVHSAHKKQGFSSIGNIETGEFSFADGKVEGTLTTNGPVDTFGESWEVNLKFVAPLGEIPKEFQVPESEKGDKEASKTSDDTATADDDDKPTTQPAGPQLRAKELA